MKDFLKTLAIWIVIMFLGLFFLGDFLLSGRHIYSATLVFSFVPAIITYIFYRQSEELEQLRDRVKKLEDRLSPAPESGAESGSHGAEQPEAEGEKP